MVKKASFLPSLFSSILSTSSSPRRVSKGLISSPSITTTMSTGGGGGCRGHFCYYPGGLTVTIALITVATLAVGTLPSFTEGYNDEKGILKWNPYWFSNFRYSAPSSFYISPNRIGTPFKRFSDSMHSSSPGLGGNYKWSPVFFSGGSSSPFPSTSWYGGGLGSGGSGGGAGYMYGSSGSRWSPMTSYSSGGGGGGGSGSGSRYRTSFFSDNSPPSAPMLDLGSNDLSELLGEEMNKGLGLENDRISILDENNNGISGGGEDRLQGIKK